MTEVSEQTKVPEEFVIKLLQDSFRHEIGLKPKGEAMFYLRENGPENPLVFSEGLEKIIGHKNEILLSDIIPLTDPKSQVALNSFFLPS